MKFLKQENLASKNDISDFVKRKEFDKNLIDINKKVASNKTNHFEAENKLSDLPGEVKLISTKRLTKYVINGYSILNGAKYFIEDGSQNCLIF